MTLISHGVLSGTVYSASDFNIKSLNSNIQNFVITLHVNLNSSSKVCFWENRHTSVGKLTFCGRLRPSEDLGSEVSVYGIPCVAGNGPVTPARLREMRIWDLPHVPEEQPCGGQCRGHCHFCDRRDTAAACCILRHHPGRWHIQGRGIRSREEIEHSPHSALFQQLLR